MKIIPILSVPLFILACTQKPTKNDYPEMKFVNDPHSSAKPNEAFVKHLDLDIEVSFENKSISGVADYQIQPNNATAEKILFDVNGVDVKKVTVEGKDVEFKISEVSKTLGSALEIPIKPSDTQLAIYFQTTDHSSALQWLNPQQTAGKEFPFLFTQSQAILARSWIPCQDSPGIRFTYHAKVKVPSNLLALMSASNPVEKNDSGIYHFQMRQAIPSYLMALAVGDVVFKEIGARTGVYAEPSLISAAVNEFSEMENMLIAAEKLYGPYAWERYDLIVLPPSFPFGGMENPRLTFATPTIIAGDKSLTSLVAHELAHSWSGNLVTNATWNDFWLNEGFTVYFEHRIMEEVYGRDYSEMLARLSFEGLLEEMEEINAENPEDTHLKLKLEGRDPDDGMSAIAYDKGYFFLRMLEEQLGRDKFDRFLNAYFTDNSFQVMTTEEFVDILKSQLLNGKQYEELKVDQWIYGPGLPDNCPKTNPLRFVKVEESVAQLIENGKVNYPSTENWSSHEWLHFLKTLPRNTKLDVLEKLDGRFNFTNSGNKEIQAAWFQLTIPAHYTKADSAVEEFLIQVGRRKFLEPLYKALIKANPDNEWPKEIYEKARPNYHAVSYQTIDELFLKETNK